MANKKAKGIDALAKAREHYEDRNSCGDWMAEALKVFRAENGDFDVSGFKACLKENGIEAPKVDMNRHGAMGRFRMCAGLMLRRHAAKQGFIMISGKKLAAPGTKKRGRRAKTAEATS